MRKTVGWHVNPETGKSVQEQITIGYAATRAEGCKYWQSTTIIPLTLRHFASNRKILWSIISEFCPLGFWHVNALQQKPKENPGKPKFSGEKDNFFIAC